MTAMHPAAELLRAVTPEERHTITSLNGLQIPGASSDSRFLLYLRHTTAIDERMAARLRQIARRHLHPDAA